MQHADALRFIPPVIEIKMMNDGPAILLISDAKSGWEMIYVISLEECAGRILFE